VRTEACGDTLQYHVSALNAQKFHFTIFNFMENIMKLESASKEYTVVKTLKRHCLIWHASYS